MDKINLGSAANSGNGDTGRAGGQKINANFAELVAVLTGDTLWDAANSESISLSQLPTQDKTSIVAAIRETFEKSGTTFSSNLAAALAIPSNWQDEVVGLTIADLQTLGLTALVEKIFFPTVQASILTNKFVALTATGASSIVEVGQPLTLTLSAAFNQGSIQDGDGSANANPLVGAATNYRFTGTNIVETNQAGNSLAIAVDAILGTNVWNVEVTHDAGVGSYFDNKGNAGNNLDAQRLAGTVSDASNTISGRLATFMGYSPNGSLTSAQIIALANKDLNTSRSESYTGVTAGAGNYLFYAYPESYGLLDSIILDGASPIKGAFQYMTGVPVTNQHGITENYIVYRSNAANAFTNNTLDFS